MKRSLQELFDMLNI